MRYILGIIGIVVGTLLVWKTFLLASSFGQIDWAERHLGGGGTYLLYKLVGILFIILSFLYMFQILDVLLRPFSNLFGGFTGP